MLAAAAIFFRESLEASLIVGVLLAYLHRAGWADRVAAVWWGVGVALALDVAVGILGFHVLQAYPGSRLQALLEGATYLIATGLLTWMSFWMKRHARGLRREMESQLASALAAESSVLAVPLLAFVTVGREGLETVLFTLALALGARPLALGVGAASGLALGLGVSYWMYHLGRRLPLGVFFNALGVVLLLFAAGLLADGVQDLQRLGWLPFAARAVWHSGGLLAEHSVLGGLLHGFFGYAQAPSVLQLAVYVAFLTVSVIGYIRLGRVSGGHMR